MKKAAVVFILLTALMTGIGHAEVTVHGYASWWDSAGTMADPLPAQLTLFSDGKTAMRIPLWGKTIWGVHLKREMTTHGMLYFLKDNAGITWTFLQVVR